MLFISRTSYTKIYRHRRLYNSIFTQSFTYIQYNFLCKITLTSWYKNDGSNVFIRLSHVSYYLSILKKAFLPIAFSLTCFYFVKDCNKSYLVTIWKLPVSSNAKTAPISFEINKLILSKGAL